MTRPAFALATTVLLLASLTACAYETPAKVPLPEEPTTYEESSTYDTGSAALQDMWDRFSPEEKQVFCTDFNSPQTRAEIAQMAGGAANVEDAMRFFRSVC